MMTTGKPIGHQLIVNVIEEKDYMFYESSIEIDEYITFRGVYSCPKMFLNIAKKIRESWKYIDNDVFSMLTSLVWSMER